MYVDPERRWMTREDRACAGTDEALWFSRSPDQLEAAKALCESCPVLDECRRDTLGEAFGVFGGRDARERLDIRREMVEEAKDWPKEKRLHYGRLCAGIHDRYDNWTRVRELTGINSALAEVLVPEWRRHQEEQRLKRLALQREKFDRLVIPRPDWPPRRGSKDAWVWYERVFRDAEINGITSDGAWYSVTIGRGSTKSMLWLTPENVHPYSKKSIRILEKNADAARWREYRRGWAA